MLHTHEVTGSSPVVSTIAAVQAAKIEDLCNGSTPDSDSVCGGSNPSSSAKKHSTTSVVECFLLGGDSNQSNAICQWHIAATSSKTGGFFDF